MDERMKERLWNAAHKKGEKKDGMNKELLLHALLNAQNKLKFSKTDLTKLDSKSLRRILRKNYDTIVSDLNSTNLAVVSWSSGETSFVRTSSRSEQAQVQQDAPHT